MHQNMPQFLKIQMRRWSCPCDHRKPIKLAPTIYDVIFPCCFGRVSSLVTVVSSANYAGNIDLHRKSDNDAMTSCLQNKLKERFARRILAFAN